LEEAKIDLKSLHDKAYNNKPTFSPGRRDGLSVSPAV